MKNHQSRPTGSEYFLEVNVISSQTHGRGCGRCRGRGRGHRQNSRKYNNHPSNLFKRKDPFPRQKRNNGETKQENREIVHKKPFKAHEETCYRCGMEGHWSHTCRTTKHLVDLFQASLKDKGKMVETNFVDGNILNLSYFDMDLFEGPSDNFNYLINDENVNIK